ADLEHGVALVVRVLREEELLQARVERLEAGLQRGQLGTGELAQLRVLPVRELAVLLDVLCEAAALAPRRHRLLELRALAREVRELAPVRDDRRIGDEALELLVAPLDLRQPVEHRSARPGARAARGHVRTAWRRCP